MQPREPQDNVPFEEEQPWNDTAWSEEERQALAAACTQEPAAGLEGRVVEHLRREGLVRSPVEEPSWSERLRSFWSPRFWTTQRLATAGGALAFVAAVFLAGVAVGQRSAARATADALATYHRDAMMTASARVQQTGSAYVEALVALGQLAVDADPQQVSQGREVALSALYAAAEELVRLDPNDPVAAQILQGLDNSHSLVHKDDDSRATRQFLWF